MARSFFCSQGLQYCRRVLLVAAALGFLLQPLAATDIYKIIKGGSLDELRQALDSGLDIEADQGKGTPLLYAAYVGRQDKVKLLLERGANINARRSDGRTALHMAANRSNRNMVELLLNAGAAPDLSDAVGNTPLIVACSNFDIQVVAAILKAKVNVNHKGQYGATPLIKAAEKGKVEIVQMLLEKGADISIREDFYHRNALETAEFFKHFHASQLIRDFAAGR